MDGCVHEYSPSLPPSLPPSLTPSLPPRPSLPSFPPSLPPSLTPSLPPSLTPSLPSLQHMKVADNVYAAGDIAQFPLPLTGDKVSIGHWQIAHNHGHVAAMNMLEKRVSFNSVPFFWTVLFGKSLRYCGEGEGEGGRESEREERSKTQCISLLLG